MTRKRGRILADGRERNTDDAPPGWVLTFLRGGGVGLLLYGIAGFVFDGSAFAAYLDLSPLENAIHLAFAALMLYAGFVRPARPTIVATLAFIGTVSLVVGGLGPTPVMDLIPTYLTNHGVIDGSWELPHHAIHMVAGVANLGAALAVRTPRGVVAR